MSAQSNVTKMGRPTVDERREILDFLCETGMQDPIQRREFLNNKIAQQASFLGFLRPEYDPEIEDNTECPNICNVWCCRDNSNGELQSVLVHKKNREQSNAMDETWEYWQKMWEHLSEETEEWVLEVSNKAIKQSDWGLPYMYQDEADEIECISTKSSARSQQYEMDLMTKFLGSINWNDVRLKMHTTNAEQAGFLKYCGFTEAGTATFDLEPGKSATMYSMYVNEETSKR
ncbi:uncharacterized protein L201_001590 [Kwoniella dendrophila CBS 6074]|uniref:N-acetyltransferase domain-containing protein n=1 Tax=Kwoniella dendrophila CBS 6074 TaxID=1295534 RepID=A0AAX4JPF6_9TREE